MQIVWAHWYAVGGYMAVASNSDTFSTWLIFWGFGSLVESKWCHYIIVEADSHLKLLPASTVDMYKLFEHINMLFWGIQQQPQIVIHNLLGSYFGVLGHLLSQHDVIMSWLRLTATSNCLLPPHHKYTQCMSTLICCPWAYDSSLNSLSAKSVLVGEKLVAAYSIST